MKDLKESYEEANKWFALHDIPSFVDDESSLYITVGGFEIQVSTSEVLYRAEEYRRLRDDNLI